MKQAVAAGWLDDADADLMRAFAEAVSAVVGSPRNDRFALAAVWCLIAMETRNLEAFGKSFAATPNSQLT